jgi:RimJ/RimL family protein N-acetyltransferase
MPVNLRDAPSVLRTGRLDLVTSDPAFAPAFADAMRASHDTLGFVAWWREAADEAVAARSLARSLELADEDIVRHAFERSTGAYVARLDLHSWDDEAPRCELGYVADARMSGRGLTREAALAMLDLAWSLGAQRVQAMCDPRNVRSVRFAEGIGMEREGVLRRYERDSDGELCDQLVLSVLRPDQPS